MYALFNQIKYLKPEEIKAAMQNMHPGLCITEGHYRGKAPGRIRDLEWNHMDQTHRLYLHNAYHDALRVVTGEHFAFSVTKFQNWPIFLPVFDVHLGPGLFYQCLNIFGLLQCHQIARLIEEGEDCWMDIQWFVASHRFLKFLHKPFSSRLAKLQAKQDSEDYVVRSQRFSLRKRGFSFKTDEPTFLNSNVLTDSMYFPVGQQNYSIAIDQNWSKTERTQVTIGPVELYVQPQDGGLNVWPALCPHEGAKIEEKDFCKNIASCAWHGRKFKAVYLEDGKNTYRMGNATIALLRGQLQVLVVQPKATSSSERSSEPAEVQVLNLNLEN